MAALARACVTFVAAPAAAVAVVPAAPVSVKQRLTNMLLRWVQPLLTNPRIWPPSRKALPFQASLFTVGVVILWLLVRQKDVESVKTVEVRRREYALSSLDNLIANEEMRIKEKAEKEAKEATDAEAAVSLLRYYCGKEEPVLVAHYTKEVEDKDEDKDEEKDKDKDKEGADADAEPAAEDAGADSGKLSSALVEDKSAKADAKADAKVDKKKNGTKEKEEKEKEKEKEKKKESGEDSGEDSDDDLTPAEKAEKERKKKDEEIQAPDEDKANKDERIAPPAEKLFELLFDEIEHSPITTIGVDKDDTRFNRGMELLAQRCFDQVKDAIDNTKMARKYSAGIPLGSSVNVPKDLPHWYDGKKMVQQAKFIKNRVVHGMKEKHPTFSKDQCKKIRALCKEALTYSHQIGAEHKRAVRQIWLLFKPWMSSYVIGVLVLMVAESSWGVWYAKIMALPNMALEAGASIPKARRQCIVFFMWFLFNWPADNIGKTLVDNVQAYFTLGMRNKVMKCILCQDREYFDFHEAGVLNQRLNHDTGMLSHKIIQEPKNLVTHVTRVIVRGGLMYAASPRLFWIAITVPIPTTVFLSWAGIKLVRELHRKIWRVNDVAAAGSINVLKEMVTVRQFAMENEEHKKYAVTNLFRQILQRQLGTSVMFTWGLIGVAFWGTQILVTYLGLKDVVAGVMTSGDLVGISLSIHEIVWVVRYLIDLIPSMLELMDPIEQVATTLDSIPRIEPHPDIVPDSPKLMPDKFMGHLKFDNVHFTYPTEKQKPVLKGFSFEVKPGQKVACVGRAGCGKSTSVGLLQRLYDPDSGSITVDGISIDKFDVHYLRRSIGIVSQDNVLFATSIRENICYGMGQGHLKKPSVEEVWDICEKANAREFIEGFPNLLNTHVGERGVKLSGGQKQRIAVARAMVRKPGILLLDEATSALDPVNEKVVQKALDNLMEEHHGCAIVIAHRLTTIKNCDNIVMMDNGKKVEEGTHKELLKIQVVKDGGNVKTGWYHNQWDTQMGEESFGSPEHMNDEQLEGRLEYMLDEKQKLDDEVNQRAIWQVEKTEKLATKERLKEVEEALAETPGAALEAEKLALVAKLNKADAKREEEKYFPPTETRRLASMEAELAGSDLAPERRERLTAQRDITVKKREESAKKKKKDEEEKIKKAAEEKEKKTEEGEAKEGEAKADEKAV